MRTQVILAIVTLLLITGPAAVADDAGGYEMPAPPDDARLEFLRQLEGRWVAPASDEAPAGHELSFHVTAGGHAVEEREFIGTPMEMLTVYHMDGRELAATHYCVLGNQPRLTAAAGLADDTLSFGCAGRPGNARSHDEEHVHAWTMRLDERGRLHYSAELVRGGEVTMAPSMVLTRQQDTARR